MCGYVVGEQIVMWIRSIHIKLSSCAEIAKFQSGSTEVYGFRNKGIKLAFLESPAGCLMEDNGWRTVF